MKHFIQAIPVCLLLFLASGCVTVVDQGSANRLFVNSDPSGARVTLSTGETGITPCQFVLLRKGKWMVVIEKEAYEQQELFVQGVPTVGRVLMSGLGNSVAGGSVLGRVGGLVDDQTDAVFELKPNPIEVKLKRKEDPIR